MSADESVPPPPSMSPPGACSPEQRCPICLEGFEDKAFVNACFHPFCFVCIVQWSEVANSCPMCKTTFQSVIHNIKSNDNYEKFEIRTNSIAPHTEISLTEARRFRYRSTRVPGRPGSPRQRHYVRQSRRAAVAERRKAVYSAGLRALPLETGERRQRVRNITAAFFRENPACSHRLFPWLSREFKALLGQEHVEFMLQIVMSLMDKVDLESEEFASHLEPFLHDKTAHFMHELLTFARSPYDMIAYDGRVSYDWPGGRAPGRENWGPETSLNPPEHSGSSPGPSGLSSATDMQHRILEELTTARWDDSPPILPSSSPIVIHGSDSEQEEHGARSPVHDPQSPVHDPQSPVHDPQSPVHDPRSPVHDPQSPVHDPRSPVHDPQSPVHDPRSPVHDPRSPVHDPRSPVHDPQSPVHDPRSPVHDPRSPVHDPRSPVHDPRSLVHDPRSPVHDPQSPAHEFQSLPMELSVNKTESSSPQIPVTDISSEVRLQSHEHNSSSEITPEVSSTTGPIEPPSGTAAASVPAGSSPPVKRNEVEGGAPEESFISIHVENMGELDSSLASTGSSKDGAKSRTKSGSLARSKPPKEERNPDKGRGRGEGKRRSDRGLYRKDHKTLCLHSDDSFSDREDHSSRYGRRSHRDDRYRRHRHRSASRSSDSDHGYHGSSRRRKHRSREGRGRTELRRERSPSHSGVGRHPEKSYGGHDYERCSEVYPSADAAYYRRDEQLHRSRLYSDDFPRAGSSSRHLRERKKERIFSDAESSSSDERRRQHRRRRHRYSPEEKKRGDSGSRARSRERRRSGSGSERRKREQHSAAKQQLSRELSELEGQIKDNKKQLLRSLLHRERLEFLHTALETEKVGSNSEQSSRQGTDDVRPLSVSRDSTTDDMVKELELLDRAISDGKKQILRVVKRMEEQQETADSDMDSS